MKRIESGLGGFDKVFGIIARTYDSAVNDEHAIYETIHVQKQVLVKVPKKSGFMEYQPAITIDNGECISQRWHNGKPLKGGLFLNLFFYGISNANLGKTIIATVKVIKKIMPKKDGRTFIIMDIIRATDTIPTTELKLPKKTGKGIEILGSDLEIEFRKR